MVELWRPDGPPRLKAEIDNISSAGFHCTTYEPFSPGERLECDLFIPQQFGDQITDLVLHRHVKVMRLEIKGLEPGFGVACQFEDSSAQIDSAARAATHS